MKMNISSKMLQLIISASLFVLCLIPASSQEVETIKVEPFNKLEVNGRVYVDLAIATQEEKMEISYEGIEKDNLLIDQSDSTLSIKIVSTLSYKDVRVMVKLHFDDLSSIISSSSASVSSQEELYFDSLKLISIGGGEIVLNTTVKELKTVCKTGGIITLKGMAETHRSELSSGGILSAFELKCKDVDIEVGTKTTAKINVENTLKANASLGGNVIYLGNPKKKKISEKLGGKVNPVK